MWIALDPVLHSENLYIAKAELLFTMCAKCHRRVVWRSKRDFASLNASCCGQCFDAVPMDRNGEIFRIYIAAVNMENVIIMTAVDA